MAKAKKAKKTLWQWFKSLWVNPGRIDGAFLLIVLLLLAFGLVTLFSSSYVYAYYNVKGDSFFFIKNQLRYAALGLFFMALASFFDYHALKTFAVPVTALASVLLWITVGLRVFVNGGAITRWIDIGPIQFQPSEIGKFAIIIIFALIASVNQHRMKDWRIGIIPFMIVFAFIALPTLLETHLSGTILIVAIGISLMLIGGTDIKYFIGMALVLAALVMGFILVFGVNYVLDRLASWRDPFVDPLGEGYQVIQSMYAIASGGLTGQGLGQSKQKFLYLPEPQNDFIFAIACEELGFIGAVLIILLFIAFVWRGFSIALRAKDRFGLLIAAGITIQFGLQALLNMMVVTKTIPNTGISLPFFSYGGTALIMLLGEMGIMLNISRFAVLEKPE